MVERVVTGVKAYKKSNYRTKISLKKLTVRCMIDEHGRGSVSIADENGGLMLEVKLDDMESVIAEEKMKGTA